MKRFRNLLITLLIGYDYDDGNVGMVSKKFKAPVGSIGCPHCGISNHGMIKPVCDNCDKPLWDNFGWLPKAEQ